MHSGATFGEYAKRHVAVYVTTKLSRPEDEYFDNILLAITFNLVLLNLVKSFK